MNEQLGDFAPGKTIRRSWPSTNGIGAMTSLAGTPALAVIRDGTLKITAGVTFVADVDYGDGATVGLNRFAIDTSADAAYAAGHDYSVIFIAGTLNGVSLVGQPVASFSLANRSATDTLAAIQAKTDNLPSDPADESLIVAATDAIMARLGAPAGASVSADVAAVLTSVALRLLTSAYTAAPTAAQNAAALLDLADALEADLTVRQALRLIVAAEAGKVSGADGATVTIRDLADTKDRLVATVTADGDRTAIIRDLS